MRFSNMLPPLRKSRTRVILAKHVALLPISHMLDLPRVSSSLHSSCVPFLILDITCFSMCSGLLFRFSGYKKGLLPPPTFFTSLFLSQNSSQPMFDVLFSLLIPPNLYLPLSFFEIALSRGRVLIIHLSIFQNFDPLFESHSSQGCLLSLRAAFPTSSFAIESFSAILLTPINLFEDLCLFHTILISESLLDLSLWYYPFWFCQSGSPRST